MSDLADMAADPRADVLGALVRVLELRDPKTARHSAAVARYARRLAEAVDLSPAQIEMAHAVGLLHDIGKFILPDRILKSSGADLSDSDWALIRRHPVEGANLLARIEGCSEIAEAILCHHERIDGTGYPCNLKGAEIPLISRIISVADSFDVMTSRDTYSRPMSEGQAVPELRRAAGSQLDLVLVETFIELVNSDQLHFQHQGSRDFDQELSPTRSGFGAVLAAASPTFA